MTGGAGLSREAAVVSATLALLLIAASQSGAVFDGDEGLHLVALQLVHDGQRPFVDFFYWHQPLYLYVASSWMTLAGDGWRSLHVLSALLTAAALLIVASTAARLGSAGRWGAPLAALFFASNALVIKWGTIAHNYALALALTAAAVAAALPAVEREDRSRAFWCGLFAGGATAVTLLLAPLAPVLALWLVRRNAAGEWRLKLAAFAAAAAIPFLPLAALAWQAPSQTFFGLVEHHLFYRVQATDAADYYRQFAASALASPQVWVVAGLTICALTRPRRRASPAEERLVSLCAWLLAALTLFVIVIHPPVHAVYFVVVAPLVALLAAAGTSGLLEVLGGRRSRRLASCGVVMLFVLGGGLAAYRERLWQSEWARVEGFAAAVRRVTPDSATFYTSYPFVYAAARRAPPEGLENGWASQMAIPAERFARLQLTPAARIAEQVRSGGFDTVLLWRDDPRFAAADLDRVYAHQQALDRYFVLRWGPTTRPQ